MVDSFGGDFLYVIGDLHGDVDCARFWVQRTRLISNFTRDPGDWVWRDNDSSLVFMGDYVDKGPTSRHTVEFVKALTDRFPLKVVALMGNHELELLMDRDPGRGSLYMQLPYATVHPAEYLNFILAPDETDRIVVGALYDASVEVYGSGLYQSTVVAPSGAGTITRFVKSPSERKRVSERLEVFQSEYLNSFRSGTELGRWLEQRPVAHLQHGVLFVHGGVDASVASVLASGLHAVSTVNAQLLENAGEEKLLEFIENTELGRVVYTMLTHRGNHKAGACGKLERMLGAMHSVKALGVGHTPGDDVRIMCDGKLIAHDAALGRWIRASGNEYCEKGVARTSKNGRYTCPDVNEACEGEITQISRDGGVSIIGAT